MVKFRMHGELYMILNVFTLSWFVNANTKNGKLLDRITKI